MLFNSTVFPMDTYIQRRAALCKALPNSKILLLGNTISPVNFKDNGYRFRQDSTFLYYIGVDLPDMVAIIDTEKNETTLIRDKAGIDAVIWTGKLMPLEERAEMYGIKKLIPHAKAKTLMTGNIHYLPPYRAEHTLQLKSLLEIDEISASQALILAVIHQRNHKSEAEIVEQEKAVALSNQMHRIIMQHTQPGIYEYDLVAEASKFAYANNVNWAYHPILTTRGEVLHNHAHGNKLSDGQMLLCDSGVELASGYCGDITRTFPVGKSFTPIQKEIYEIVHKAYLKGIALAQPGNTYLEAHLAAAKTIVLGLQEIGWMKGDADEAVATGAHTMFFQHGLGHMIGMDVHDMENLGEQYVGYDAPHIKSTEFGLKSLRLARQLEPGHCLTVEPGIYVIPELIDKFKAEGKHLSFINYAVLDKHRDAGGIRIEDNLVITENGNRILDGSLPTDLAAIESLRTEAMEK